MAHHRDSHTAVDKHLADPVNRVRRVEAFRADIRTIHDGATPEEFVYIVQFGEPFLRRLFAAVLQETACL